MELVYQSRAPYSTWPSRIDPVHEVTWSNTVRSKWEHSTTKRHVLRIDHTGHLVHDIKEKVSPLRRSDKEMYSPGVIMAMAMLTEWNQLSTFQLSALIGIPVETVKRVMWRLYSSGIVYRLTPEWWEDGVSETDSGSGYIWRIDRKSWTTQRWFDSLGNLEWALTTNGLDPFTAAAGTNSPTSLRHNLAIIETCIKAMEVCPGVIGAWGDHHSRSEMFYDASRIRSDKVRNNIGDGVLLTRDGKIIVLEAAGTTSSMSTKEGSNLLISKAAAWTSIAGRSGLDLRVVFLDISPQPRPFRIRKFIKIGVESASRRYVSSVPMREKGQARIYVADSRDWFPVSRTISTDFTTLRTWQPITGDTVDLAPPSISDHPVRDQHQIINTLASLHMPAWIHSAPGQSFSTF